MSDLLFDLPGSSLQHGCDLSLTFLDLFMITESTVTCEGFNTADTCGNSAFGYDFKSSDHSGIGHMSASAKFLGKISHRYYPDFFSVFFSEQGHSPGLLSLINGHNIGLHRKICLDFFIYKSFCLLQLFRCHCLEMCKVKTESVRSYQRSFLLNMRAQDRL